MLRAMAAQCFNYKAFCIKIKSGSRNGAVSAKLNHRFNDGAPKGWYHACRNEREKIGGAAGSRKEAMMNLKEAFRYQNKLDSLIDEAEILMSAQSNLLQTKSTYLRHKVDPSYQDEEVLEANPSDYAAHMTDVVSMVLYLLDLKEKLSQAIRRTKNELPIDIDAEVTLNRARQSAAGILRNMVNLRSSEVTISGGGYGYRFNQEGNQVSYKCDVRKVKTITFNRGKVRGYLTDLSRKMEAVSAEIDRCVVNASVDVEMPFDVNASFDEVFEFYMTGDLA